MFTLQQVDFHFVDEAKILSTSDFIVARHRRTSTLLSYSKGNRRFDLIHHDEARNILWFKKGSWTAPDEIRAIISVHPVEAYDAFVFIVMKAECTGLVLIDLMGNIIRMKTIAESYMPLSADVDQQRRELLVGFNSGKLDCFYMHIPPKTVETGVISTPKSPARRKVQSTVDISADAVNAKAKLHITLRRRLALGGEFGHYAKQVCTVDLLGMMLVLMDSGVILCFDSARFDLLYALSNELFLYAPSKLMVDKFGSKFVVLSTDGSRERVELWVPPSDFTSCEIGQFGRIPIPTDSQLLGMRMESVGTKMIDTILITVTVNFRLQLWRPFGDESLAPQCILDLSLDQKLLDDMMEVLPTVLSLQSETLFAGLPYQFGSFEFVESESILPHSPVNFEIGVFNGMAKFALHHPRAVERQYQATYSDISISQIDVIETAQQQQHAIQEQQRQLERLQKLQTILEDEHSDDAELLSKVLSEASPVQSLGSAQSSETKRSNRNAFILQQMSSILGTTKNNSTIGENKSIMTPALRLESEDEQSQMSATLRSILEDMAVQEEKLNEFAASQLSKLQEDNEHTDDASFEMPTGSANFLVEPSPPITNSSVKNGAGDPLSFHDSETLASTARTKRTPPPVNRTDETPPVTRTSTRTDIDTSPGIDVETSAFEQAGQDSRKSSAALNSIMRDGLAATIEARESTSPHAMTAPGSPLPFLATNVFTENSSIDPKLQSEVLVSNRSETDNMAAHNVPPKSIFFCPGHAVGHVDYTSGVHPVDTTRMLRVCLPYGAVIRSNGEDVDLRRDQQALVDVSMQLVSRKGLIDVKDLNLRMPIDDLNFKLCGIAYRAALLGIITTMREAYIFDLSTNDSSSAYTNIEFDIRHGVATTALLHADIYLRAPVHDSLQSSDTPVATTSTASNRQRKRSTVAQDRTSVMAVHGKSAVDKLAVTSRPLVQTATKKNKSVAGVKAAKKHQDSLGEYSLFAVGDSDGMLHYSVATKDKVHSNKSFRAHDSCGIVGILCTGDPVRPLWRVSSRSVRDKLTGVTNEILETIPGSAIITLGKDGEVKVWQPRFVPKAQGLMMKASFDKLFITYDIEWHIAGLFLTSASSITRQPTARRQMRDIDIMQIVSADNTGNATPASTAGGAGSRSKSIGSARIDPTCMNIIISYRNGFIEVWPIPGLIDSRSTHSDGSSKLQLATSQQPILSTFCHFDVIQDINLWVHASSTSIQEIDIGKENSKRDEMISGLAAFVRSGAKWSVGYTLKQLRTMTAYSSMVTSSKDRSIVIWSFTVSDTELDIAASMFLCPQPCRRFTFSNTPTYGLCYCTSYNVSHFNTAWRVAAIVDGIVVTAYEDFRSKMFSSVYGDSIGRERLPTLTNNSANDFPATAQNVPFSLNQRPPTRQSITAVPAMNPVERAAPLVASIAKGGVNERASRISWQLLNEWALVVSDQQAGVGALFYDSVEDEEVDDEPNPQDQKFTSAVYRPPTVHEHPIEFVPDEGTILPPRPKTPFDFQRTQDGLVKTFSHGIHMVGQSAEEVEQVDFTRRFEVHQVERFRHHHDGTIDFNEDLPPERSALMSVTSPLLWDSSNQQESRLQRLQRQLSEQQDQMRQSSMQLTARTSDERVASSRTGESSGIIEDQQINQIGVMLRQSDMVDVPSAPAPSILDLGSRQPSELLHDLSQSDDRSMERGFSRAVPPMDPLMEPSMNESLSNPSSAVLTAAPRPDSSNKVSNSSVKQQRRSFVVEKDKESGKENRVRRKSFVGIDDGLEQDGSYRPFSSSSKLVPVPPVKGGFSADDLDRHAVPEPMTPAAAVIAAALAPLKAATSDASSHKNTAHDDSQPANSVKTKEQDELVEAVVYELEKQLSAALQPEPAAVEANYIPSPDYSPGRIIEQIQPPIDSGASIGSGGSRKGSQTGSRRASLSVALSTSKPSAVFTAPSSPEKEKKSISQNGTTVDEQSSKDSSIIAAAAKTAAALDFGNETDNDDDRSQGSVGSIGLDSLSAMTDSVMMEAPAPEPMSSAKANALRDLLQKSAKERLQEYKAPKGPVYTSKASTVKTKAQVNMQKFIRTAHAFAAFKTKNQSEKKAVVVKQNSIRSSALRLKSPMDTAMSPLEEFLSRGNSPEQLPGAPLEGFEDTADKSDGKHPNTTDKSQTSSKGSSSVTAAPVEFEINVPVSDAPFRRKGVQTFLDRLQSKVKESGGKVQEIVQNEDEESVVTSYFDRSAKPIFVERGNKKEKHRLRSKRHDKRSAKSKASATQLDMNDSIEGDSVDQLRSDKLLKSRTRSASYDGVEDDDDEDDDLGALMEDDRGIPNFDLERFLGVSSQDERDGYDKLNSKEKALFINEVNREFGKQNVQAFAGNKKHLAKFRDILKRALADARERRKLNMDINMESLDATDTTIWVSASSEAGGAVFLILVETGLNSKPPVEAMSNKDAILEIPGLQDHIAIEIPENSYIEHTFTNLSPDTTYYLYGVVNRTQSRRMLMSDELEDRDFPFIEVSTAKERLEIEFDRLSTEMARVEVQTALRCDWVRKFASTYYPPITLPDDSDIVLPYERPKTPIAAATDTLRTKSGSMKDKSNRAQNKNDKSHQSDEEIAAEKKKKVWNSFYDFWIGASSQGMTKTRMEFLLREAIFAAQHPMIVKQYLDSGICSGPEEASSLKEFASHMETLLQMNKIKKENIVQSDEFVKFRSWYKGGQVLKKKIEEGFETASVGRNSPARVDSVASVGSIASARSAAVTATQSMMDDSIITITDKQLALRTNFLESRVKEFDVCLTIVNEIIDLHRFSKEKNLSDQDLVYRRAQLQSKDVMAIMSSKKLLQLCVTAKLTNEAHGLNAIPLEAFGSGKYTAQAISAADVFRINNPEKLNPDEPSPIPMATLPGSSRTPLKAWQLCSEEEKLLEVAMACSLDCIIELAVEDGIMVPDPEDCSLKPGMFHTRDKRWENFTKWYAGNEYTNNIPGSGIPTLQRVIFAEEWEMECVKYDRFIVDALQERNVEIPSQYIDSSGEVVFAQEGLDSSSEVPNDQGSSAGVVSSFGSTTRESVVLGTVGRAPSTYVGPARRPKRSSSLFKDNMKGYFGPLIKLYSDVVGKISGAPIRFKLLCRHLELIIGCRRMSLIRWMWPPGAGRLGRQVMIPRMGLLFPRFELPPPRIRVFPSRRPDAYTHMEIVGWYSGQDLTDDDELMRKAELRGQKMKAYNDWLALEKERREETREDMIQEDANARVRRQAEAIIEQRLRDHEESLIRRLEEPREEDPDKDRELKFSQALPAEYWYIFEESNEFKHGSGIQNEDEMEELRELERERARQAKIEADKFENYLQEERRKREQEESMRQKREEQDRRLAEGVARRRRLREHLEELKRMRIIRAAEEERALEEAERERLEAMSIAEQIRRKEEEKQREIQRRIDENQSMAVEDILVRELQSRTKEIKNMEHEDVLSFIQEQIDLNRIKNIDARKEELKKLYVPFEPFHFGSREQQLPKLQELLYDEKNSVDPVYQEVIQTLATRRRRSSVTESVTASSHRKRSMRYISIYEGDAADAPVDFAAAALAAVQATESLTSPSSAMKSSLRERLLTTQSADSAANTKNTTDELLGVSILSGVASATPFNDAKVPRTERVDIDSTGDGQSILSSDTSAVPVTAAVDSKSASHVSTNTDRTSIGSRDFRWLRKPINPEVRPASHSMKKQQIRLQPSDDVPSLQWTLLDQSSTQCFVLSSGKSFRELSGPSGVAQRNLSQVRPILEPLQDRPSIMEQFKVLGDQLSTDSEMSSPKYRAARSAGARLPPSSRVELEPLISRPSSTGLHLRGVSMGLSSHSPLLGHATGAMTGKGTDFHGSESADVLSHQRVLIQNATSLATQHTSEQPSATIEMPTVMARGESENGSVLSYSSEPRNSSIMKGSEVLLHPPPPQDINRHSADPVLGDLLELYSSHQEATENVSLRLDSRASPSGVGSVASESLFHSTTGPSVAHGDDSISKMHLAEALHDHTYFDASATSDGIASATKMKSRSSATQQSRGSKKARENMKRLLSTSANTIAKSDQRAWLQFLRDQERITYASLQSLDSKDGKMKPKLIQSKSNKERKVTSLTELEPNSKKKEKEVQQLKEELKQLGIVDESLMDFRTKKLAKTASEAVIRMRGEKDLLRHYVSSGAITEDGYYLMAMEPGQRKHSSLEVSDEVRKFSKTIVKQQRELRMSQNEASNESVSDEQMSYHTETEEVDDDDGTAVESAASTAAATAAKRAKAYKEKQKRAAAAAEKALMKDTAGVAANGPSITKKATLHPSPFQELHDELAALKRKPKPVSEKTAFKVSSANRPFDSYQYGGNMPLNEISGTAHEFDRSTKAAPSEVEEMLNLNSPLAIVPAGNGERPFSRGVFPMSYQKANNISPPSSRLSNSRGGTPGPVPGPYKTEDDRPDTAHSQPPDLPTPALVPPPKESEENDDIGNNKGGQKGDIKMAPLHAESAAFKQAPSPSPDTAVPLSARTANTKDKSVDLYIQSPLHTSRGKDGGDLDEESLGGFSMGDDSVSTGIADGIAAQTT